MINNSKRVITSLFLILELWKGVDTMALAEYLAFRVMGLKMKFTNVPKALQEQVRVILVDLGFEELTK